MDYATVISAIVAVCAALVSIYALILQRRSARIALNVHFLNDSLSMLKQDPALLELHGVDQQKLNQCDVTAEELIYMLNSIYAGQSYYGAGNERRVRLGPYRKNLLSHPKFEAAWKIIIRDHFTIQSPFTTAIDSYYRDGSLSNDK